MKPITKRRKRKPVKAEEAKPPGRDEREAIVLMWLLSQSNDAEKRLFDEWSYNM